MTEAGVRADFRHQAQECRSLGSPFTARLLGGLADRMKLGAPVADRVLNWPGDAADALPLRLAGGLHALVLMGHDADLAAVYPPNNADDDALLLATMQAIGRHADFLVGWLDSPPQTNEVARSAVLIATAHWLTARFGLPIVLSELGASAGLNLLFDRFALQIGAERFGPVDPTLTLTPDWRGAVPPADAPRLVDRAGVDLSPLDPVTDRLRLLAYVWADQTARRDRCHQALRLAASIRPEVTQGDAAPWLEQRLSQARPGALHLVFHTVAAKYFSPQTQSRVTEALTDAGTRATPDSPVAHLSLEWDGPTPGAALTLTLSPGGQIIPLGRADFHGRWVDWRAPPP